MDILQRIRTGKWDLALAGTGLLGLLILFAAVIPAGITIYGNFSEASRNRQRLALVTGSGDARQRLTAEFRALDSLRVSLGSRLASNRFSNLLESINDAAAAAGVEVVTLHPADAEKESRCTRQPLQLTVKGHYHGMGRFINAVERLDHIIAVDRLALQAENMLSDELKASVTLGVYSSNE